MNLKKTLLFAAILIALLAYIIYIEVPEQNEELTKSSIVKNTAQEEIEKISISHDDINFEIVNKNPHSPKPHDPAIDVSDSNDEITGEAQDKTDWILPDVPAASLDAGRVNAITSAIASLSSNAVISAADIESDMSLYGLAKPELTLTFQAKGKTTKLIFGTQNEFAGDRYLKIEGRSELYLVNDALFEAGKKTKDDLRDKTPISFSDASVSGIEVHSNNSKVLITPTESREWRITEPVPARASTGAVYDLFRNLRNLQVLSFVDSPTPDLKQYGLDAPKVSIAIKRTSGDITVDLSRAGDKSWLRLNKAGAVYQVSGDPIVSISQDVNIYREKQLFKFDNFFAKEISIKRADGSSLSLKKEGEVWKINGKESDAPFVRQYIKDLSDVRALGFPQGSLDFGFGKPALTVTVLLSDESSGTKSRTLVVGDKASEGLYAAVDDQSEPFVISDETFRSINASEERFLPVKPDKPS